MFLLTTCLIELEYEFMQSQAKDVAAYIEEAPPDRREALLKLRQLCLDTLEGYTGRNGLHSAVL